MNLFVRSVKVSKHTVNLIFVFSSKKKKKKPLLTAIVFAFEKILFHPCETPVFVLDEIRIAQLYPTELVQLKVINKAHPLAFEARMHQSDKSELPRFHGFLIT